MRIRVYRAFASNNSGSYTIVGSFPTPEKAAEVARVLAPLIEAQSKWFASDQRKRPSPLERLAIDEMLSWDDARDSSWPDYGGKDSPDILAVGSQVLVHHGYTVSMPRVFGHFFYSRGGAVDVTLDHAHHALVAVFEVWWGWDEETRKRVPELSRALHAELGDEAGPLRANTRAGVEPVLHAHEGAFHPLVAAAVFDDLVVGVEAVRAVVEKHSAHMRLSIHENKNEAGDPLASLRRAGERSSEV